MKFTRVNQYLSVNSFSNQDIDELIVLALNAGKALVYH